MKKQGAPKGNQNGMRPIERGDWRKGVAKNADPSVKKEYRELGNRKRALKHNAEFDPIEAYKLRKAGFSNARIAELLTPKDREKQLSQSAICRAIGRLVDSGDAEMLPSGQYEIVHKKVMTELLEKKQIQALRQITPKKLKEESARDNAMTAKLLHEQLRLEQGKSTNNTASMNFVQIVEKSNGGNGL